MAEGEGWRGRVGGAVGGGEARSGGPLPCFVPPTPLLCALTPEAELSGSDSLPPTLGWGVVPRCKGDGVGGNLALLGGREQSR